MRFLPFLLAFLLLGVFCPSAFSVDNDKSIAPEKTVEYGIRFIFQELPEGLDDHVYLSFSENDSVDVPVIMGLAGVRVTLPEKGHVTLYAKPVAQGEKQKKLLNEPLPEQIEGHLIAVILPREKGWKSFYLKEKEIKPGTVILRNIMDKPVRIQLGKDSPRIMEPEEQFVFDPGIAVETSRNIHPGKIFQQTSKGDWYVSRQFSLKIRQLHAELNLFVWDKKLKRPTIQKIILTPE